MKYKAILLIIFGIKFGHINLMIFGIKIIINYLTLKNNLSVDNECKCQMLSLLYHIFLRMGRYRKDPIPPVQNLCRRKGEGVKKTLDLLWLFQDI